MALLTEETIEELLRHFPAQPAAALAARPPPRSSSGRHGTTGTSCTLVHPPLAAPAMVETDGSRPSTHHGPRERKKLTGIPIHTTARAATRQQLLPPSSSSAAAALPSSSAEMVASPGAVGGESRDNNNDKSRGNEPAAPPTSAPTPREKTHDPLSASSESSLPSLSVGEHGDSSASRFVSKAIAGAAQRRNDGKRDEDPRREKDFETATSGQPPLHEMHSSGTEHTRHDRPGEIHREEPQNAPLATETGAVVSSSTRHTSSAPGSSQQQGDARATTPRSALQSTATITPTPRHAGQGISTYRSAASAVSLRSDEASGRPPTRGGAGALSVNAMARVERSEQRKYLLEQQLALERVYWSTKYAFQGLRTQVEQHIYARELAAMWTQRTDRSPYWLDMVDEMRAATEATMRWKRNPEFVVRPPARLVVPPPPPPPSSSSGRAPSPASARRDEWGARRPQDTPTRARGQVFDGVARALLQRNVAVAVADTTKSEGVAIGSEAEKRRSKRVHSPVLPPVDHRLVVNTADLIHVVPASSAVTAVALYEVPYPMPLYAQPRPYPPFSRGSPNGSKRRSHSRVAQPQSPQRAE